MNPREQCWLVSESNWKAELRKRGDIGTFSAGLLRVAEIRLLVLDDKGFLRLVERDPRGYRELAKAQVCAATFVTPALANGMRYARDNKSVVCVQLGE